MLQSIYPAVQKSYQTCQPTNQQPASQPDRQPAACNLLVIGPPFGLLTPLTSQPASQQSTCYRATIRPLNSVNIPASQPAPSQAGVPKNLIFWPCFYFIFKPILEPLWIFILIKNLENLGSKAACRGLTKMVRKNVRFWSLLNLEN